MSTDTKSEQYKNIINVSKYKILIVKQINWCLDNLVYKEKWNNLDELYNCYKIIFKHKKLYMIFSRTCIDDITQEFTIHHFIYCLITEVVKVFKRRSKRFTEYDIFDLLMMNIQTAYQVHLDNLIQKIYDYLYPTANLQILSNLFLIFKDINIFGGYNRILKMINHYDNFTECTEYDLLYNLMYYIEIEESNDSIISVIYFQIVENIKKFGRCTMNDVIELIRCYEQIRAQERLKIYEEELIMKTWHPTRLMDWCLDIEEKNDFAE